MIPGDNILAQALTVIGSTPVKYFKYSSKTTNSSGLDVVTYLPGVMINTGSVQPIDKNKYEFAGLDFEKSYINWYVPSLDAIDIARDNPGDVIEVLGRRFQLQSGIDWLLIDGWRRFVAVDIGVASGATTNA